MTGTSTPGLTSAYLPLDVAPSRLRPAPNQPRQEGDARQSDRRLPRTLPAYRISGTGSYRMRLEFRVGHSGHMSMDVQF